jgi:hypothetical protein
LPLTVRQTSRRLCRRVVVPSSQAVGHLTK